MTSPQPLPKGQILDKRYRIVRQLGEGSFGRTYLAENINCFNDRCVLKEFAPQVKGAAELAKAKELFEREALVLYKLQHPQIPRFREMLQTSFGGKECLLLVQDYVEGDTYLQLLKSRQKFSEAEVIGLLNQILPVLSYIHSQGAIHRDISPDNLMLRSSDKLPVLIDFGGVKQVAKSAVWQFTNMHLNTRIGKEGYAPEEQMRGKVYPNSDLYALAVTALVLLTGKKFKDLYDSFNATWLWGKEISVSRGLEAVLQKMLAYQPGDRYQSAEEALQALSQINPTPPHPNPQQPATPAIAKPVAPQNRSISNIQTIVVAPGGKPNPSPNYQQPATQVSAKPARNFGWLYGWWVRFAVGTGAIAVAAIVVWGLVKPLLNSIPSIPVVRSPSASPASDPQTRIEKISQRRAALGIKPIAFNNLVDNAFYAKHPQLKRRPLNGGSEDAALRQEWYNIAENLLDKLEKDKLTQAPRGQ